MEDKIRVILVRSVYANSSWCQLSIRGDKGHCPHPDSGGRENLSHLHKGNLGPALGRGTGRKLFLQIMFLNCFLLKITRA